jgi:hypothetical protein
MTLTGNTLFITGGSGIGLVLGGLRRVAVRFGGVRASTEFHQTRTGSLLLADHETAASRSRTALGGSESVGAMTLAFSLF